MKIQNKYKKTLNIELMLIKNNINIKDSLVLILNIIQTLIFMFNTSWTTLNTLTKRSWAEHSIQRWIKETQTKTHKGVQLEPKTLKNSVTVSRIKAQFCTLQGHWLVWSYVDKQYLRRQGLWDTDGITVCAGVHMDPAFHFREYHHAIIYLFVVYLTTLFQ
jgi:hypothetical protein